MERAKSIKCLYLFTILIGLSITPYCHAQSSNTITCRLKQVFYSQDSRAGLYNIFFNEIEKENIKYPPEWKHVRIALFTSGEGCKPVYMIRYTDGEGNEKYRLDNNADLDFTDETDLIFRDGGGIKYSEIVFPLKAEDNSYQITVNYRIILAEQYSYAMLNDYREGELSINGQSVKVSLSLERGKKIYDLSGGAYISIDVNRDGFLKETTEVSSNGNILVNEKIPLADPFIVDNHKYEVAEVSKDGYSLIIKESQKEFAPSAGFYMPELSLADFDGRSHSLKEYQGKKILLQFWSSSCPNSESIRTVINKIIEQNKDNLVSINIPCGDNVEEVKKYLSGNPSKSIYLFADNKVVDILDPQSITPLFYFIDENGKVVIKEAGSSFVKVIGYLLK